MGCLKLNYYREQAPFFVKVEKPDKEGSKECMQGWLSVDPMASEFPSMSPYAYCYNNPIAYFDPNGEYGFPTDKIEQYRKDYPHLVKYIETQVKSDVMRSQTIKDAFMASSANNFTESKVQDAVTWNSGPMVEFVDNPPDRPYANDPGFHGYYDQELNTIFLSASDAKKANSYLNTNATAEDKLASFLPWFKELMHETAEFGNSVQGSSSKKYNPNIEPGLTWESFVYGSNPEVYNPYGDPKTQPNANLWNRSTAQKVIIQQRLLDLEDTLPTTP